MYHVFHILVNQFNLKTSTINNILNKVAGGVGEFKNCVSQTFHRKPIKFCCELGFIWCNSRLWWTGKVKVQLCLSWKKMKVQLRLSAKSESARTNCSGFMSLACFPSALHLAWQRKAIIALYLALYLLSQHQPWLPNLHISSAYTVPCWLRHWPKVFVNQSPNKINTCSQVAVGEELTWSYTNVLQPQAATLSKHLDTWMFQCTCPRWKTLSTEAIFRLWKWQRSTY